MKVFVYPYTAASKSAKTIADELGIKRIKLEDSKFKYDPSKIIINWGNSNCPFNARNVLNTPDAIIRASNKLSAARAFYDADVPHLQIATVRGDAVFGSIAMWKEYEDFPVIARTKLSARSGAGAYYFESPKEIPNNLIIDGEPVKYLSRYQKKKDEYRVHVVDSRVIDVVQKKRRKDFEGDVDSKIRSYERGWVFAREGVEAPAKVTAAAVQAVKALGLDFGAVDIGWNEHHKTATVYEVNSAPGMEGTTIERYTAALQELAEKRYKDIQEKQNA